ncbi:MAG TPA: LysR family transcriptional regulator [Bryobacteraceae bacterium]|nr:LysR family transcriptional regulator [Bryobacteraceae bacterium]
MAFETQRLFRDIAASRSFSQGARLNDLSQSSASQAVQDLERQLGIILLDRSTRPLTVTDAGRLYLDLCKDVLRREEEFQAELDRVKRQVAGIVRVASIYSVGLSELAQLEQEFRAQYPDALLQIEYLRPEKVFEAVASDRADLGLMSYAEPTRGVVVLPWREEEMVVAASPWHPLAGRSEIAPADLDNLEFVGFDEDLPIRRNIDRFLRDHGVTVRLVMHFDNLQMIKEAVAHGAGVSIMPARVMRDEIGQGRLLAIPLAGTTLFRPLRIVHRRRKQFNAAGQAFLELLRQAPGERAAEPLVHAS